MTFRRPFSNGRRRGDRARRLWVLAAVLSLVGLFSLRYRLIWVVGDSMLPTYASGNLLVVDRWAYHRSVPGRGDVVVARHQADWMVKRVVGLPGELIAVRDGQVQVDGVSVPEWHPVREGPLQIEPGRLPADRFALLGDNRELPPDALVHAVVHRDRLMGRVVFPARSSIPAAKESRNLLSERIVEGTGWAGAPPERGS